MVVILDQTPRFVVKCGHNFYALFYIEYWTPLRGRREVYVYS